MVSNFFKWTWKQLYISKSANEWVSWAFHNFIYNFHLRAMKLKILNGQKNFSQPMNSVAFVKMNSANSMSESLNSIEGLVFSSLDRVLGCRLAIIFASFIWMKITCGCLLNCLRLYRNYVSYVFICFQLILISTPDGELIEFLIKFRRYIQNSLLPKRVNWMVIYISCWNLCGLYADRVFSLSSSTTTARTIWMTGSTEGNDRHDVNLNAMKLLFQ